MIPSTATTKPAKIPRDALYRLSRPFCEIAMGRQPGRQGLRLLHVLAHLMCRSVEHWHGTGDWQPETGYAEQCILVRKRLGLRDANDNAALAAGMEALRLAGIVEWAEFRHDRQWLAWRFEDDLWHMLFSDSIYGQFDIRRLREVTTPLDHVLYPYLGLAYRMRRPEELFDLNGLGAVAGCDGRWSRLRPGMVASLRRLAPLFGGWFVVGLECTGTRRGIDAALVRLCHPGTSWHRAPLTSFSRHTRKVLVIDANHCIETTTGEAASVVASHFWPKRASGDPA